MWTFFTLFLPPTVEHHIHICHAVLLCVHVYGMSAAFSHFSCTYLLKPVLFDLSAFEQIFTRLNTFVITGLLRPLQIRCTANVSVYSLLLMAFVCGSASSHGAVEEDLQRFTWSYPFKPDSNTIPHTGKDALNIAADWLHSTAQSLLLSGLNCVLCVRVF